MREPVGRNLLMIIFYWAHRVYQVREMSAALHSTQSHIWIACDWHTFSDKKLILMY